MSEQTPGSLTQLLTAVNNGDTDAQDTLWTLVYSELRRIAGAQMRREVRGDALQTTALVNEAYLRLVGNEDVQWANRRHFFGAAAEAMRRIRVDDARRRGRLKRGGGQAAEPLQEEPAVAGHDPSEVLAINDSLAELEQQDARKAEVVKLRYFAGLSVDDTAHALGLSPRTVDNEWRFARAWLHRALSQVDSQTNFGTDG